MWFEPSNHFRARHYSVDVFNADRLATIPVAWFHALRMSRLEKGLTTAKFFRLDDNNGTVFCQITLEIIKLIVV